MTETLSAKVVVIGAGPAGIAAATRAAEAGTDVLVLDDGPGAGGQIWRHRGSPPRSARRWIDRFRRSGARLVTGTQVVFAQRGRLVAERSTGSLCETFEVSAPIFLVATGARERYLPFPGWTLPGVVGVGAAQALLKGGVSFRGRRVVVAGTGPLLLAAAAALASDGARVRLVAEQAARHAILAFALGLARSPGKLLAAARYRFRFPAARYRTGTWVRAASGDGAVAQVVLTDGRRSWTERCDLLCTGYGLIANLELPILLGCAVTSDRVRVDEFQRTSLSSVLCAGEATGVGGVELALVEGEIAGLAAAGRAAQARSLFAKRAHLAAFAASMERAFVLRAELKALPRPDTIVCRCEDVVFGRLDPSWVRRQAKLYTRVGMGPCQGKVCGPALEFLLGWTGDSVRIPVRPASLESFIAQPENSHGGEIR